ncbi:PTS sugar transporter [Listeria monocytogenes]|nr:PTS sugar transporter [Listeria monocytogenes]GAT40384.1 PTS sugar transporter [Listeria monocytogenes]
MFPSKKRTCGPSNKTSISSKWLAASASATAKIFASRPFSAAAFSIFVTSKLVDIPAEHTNMIVFMIISSSR